MIMESIKFGFLQQSKKINKIKCVFFLFLHGTGLGDAAHLRLNSAVVG